MKVAPHVDQVTPRILLIVYRIFFRYVQGYILVGYRDKLFVRIFPEIATCFVYVLYLSFSCDGYLYRSGSIVLTKDERRRRCHRFYLYVKVNKLKEDIKASCLKLKRASGSTPVELQLCYHPHIRNAFFTAARGSVFAGSYTQAPYVTDPHCTDIPWSRLVHV